MINKQLLIETASDIGVQLTPQQAEKFDLYAQTLVEWNEKINLTAITEPDEIVYKHFIDSLYLLKYIKAGDKLVDVGTGAGFPSIPCLIASDNFSLTMVDTLNKRVNFLNELTNTLDLKATSIHGRAEEVTRIPEHREKYDIATARAVANLSILCELCLPYVKVGGRFIALKGATAKQELDGAKQAIKLLGGEIEELVEYNPENLGARGLVIIKKISQTSPKYPRIYGKIKNSPL